MKKGQPITPEDIQDIKKVAIPGFVFDAFNTEIALNMSNGCAKVEQRDVVERIKDLGNLDAIKYEWLNVEDAYRGEGWKLHMTNLPIANSTQPFL